MKATISLLFILFLALTAFGQDIEAITKDGKKEIVESGKDPFAADDFKEVQKFADSIQKEIAKSEYETEIEYKNRIAKLLEVKRFNGKSIKQIAFLIKSPSIEYSTDKQSFEFYISGDKNISFVNRRSNFFSVGDFSKTLKMSSDKAQEIKPFFEVIIFGFPVKSSIQGIEVVPTQLIVRHKNTGEIYLNEKVSNFSEKPLPTSP